MKASDITDETILAAIKATRGRNGVPEWATTGDVLRWFEANKDLPLIPPKVILTKLESCIRRKLIDGHVCSKKGAYCRGDFEIIETEDCGK
jgi:hypothetical protein